MTTRRDKNVCIYTSDRYDEEAFQIFGWNKKGSNKNAPYVSEREYIIVVRIFRRGLYYYTIKSVEKEAKAENVFSSSLTYYIIFLSLSH
jgi:hypothetical protein